MITEETFVERVNLARDQLLSLARSVQDNRNRARFFLATAALVNLIRVDSLYSRRELIIPPLDVQTVKASSKALQKELASKSWVNAFLRRLVDRGLVTEERTGHELLYSVTLDQREPLVDMIYEALESDGRTIKALLWPHDETYAESQEFPDAEAPLAPESEPEQDPALDTITELTGQLAQVALHLQGVVNGLSALDQKMTDKFQLLDGLDSRLGEQVQSLDTLRASLDTLLRALQDERRVQLAGILERFIEMQSRKQSLANQFESEARKEERLIADLLKQVESYR